MPAENVVVEQKITKVVVSSTGQQILVKSPQVKITQVGVQGPPGSTGAAGTPGNPGPAGPQGPPGVGDAHYIHNQIAASNHWVVNHNLGKRPAILVIDTAGSTIIGSRSDPDSNTTILDFTAPFSGTVDCN